MAPSLHSPPVLKDGTPVSGTTGAFDVYVGEAMVFTNIFKKEKKKR